MAELEDEPGAGARALLRPDGGADGRPRRRSRSSPAASARASATRRAGCRRAWCRSPGGPFLEHVMERLARGGGAAGRDLPRPPGRGDRGRPRRRGPLRPVDRLLRRGPRADRHRGRPAAGAARCWASASWSCTATPTCAVDYAAAAARHERSGRAGPDDRPAQPRPLGPEQRRLRARAACAPTTSAPAAGGRVDRLRPAGPDARAPSRATRPTSPTSCSGLARARASWRACRSARASTRSARPRRSRRPSRFLTRAADP